MSAPLSLILGGARSGKSRRAEALAAQSGLSVVYVSTCATALADAEMQERIRVHRAQRPAEWTTIENQFALDVLFAEHAGKTVLLDCLTLWLSFQCESTPEPELLARLLEGLQAARAHGVTLFIVSNEMGMGLVPSHPLGRSFRDLCGRANQLVAAHADHVEFQIAGLPLMLKGGLTP